MPATAMNHFTVLTDDVPVTVAFYCDILGLTDGPRPPLGFDGAWLYAEGQAVVHIIGERSRSELRAGVIDHMAFSATGLSNMVALLDAKGMKYQCRQQIGTGIWQVFVHDPNGAKVELDFAPDEKAPNERGG